MLLVVIGHGYEDGDPYSCSFTATRDEIPDLEDDIDVEQFVLAQNDTLFGTYDEILVIENDEVVAIHDF